MIILLAVLSGMLLVLCFPPFNLIFLAWIALVPLLISIGRAKKPNDAFLLGFIFGLVFFFGNLFWVNTLIVWAGAWLVLGFILLIMFQAVFISIFSGLAFYIKNKLVQFELILIPMAWVFIEWVRSLGPLGVTGGGLGYTQIDFPLLVQIARLIKIYGISFLIVLGNIFFMHLILEKGRLKERLMARKLETAIVFLAAIFIFGYGINSLSQSRQLPNKLRVSVIQAAIPQNVKLDCGQVISIVNLHEILSRKALNEKPRLIIWPETAITTYLNLAPNIQRQISKLVKDSKVYYLIGTSHTTGDRNYNSVAAFSPKGEFISRYNKHALVPFGEYLPLRPVIYPILKSINLLSEDYHSDTSDKIIDLGLVKVGVVICFESTFPYLVRNKVEKGADFIVVVTNDAWFGKSSALAQHLQSTRMRAVENGIYIVQAANSGISAIIDPAGRVIKRTTIDDEAIMTGEVEF